MSIFVQALRSMRRSPYQAAAATLILFLTFFVGYSLVYFLLGSNKVLQYFESRPQVTAFFNQKTKLDDLNQEADVLRKQSGIKDVKVVSQEDALQIYKQQSSSDPTLQELVTADILPPSLEVSTDSIDQLGPVADQLKSLPGIDEVVYQKDVVDSLRHWTALLRKIGFSILGLFTVTSLLVILVITSIRIASKKGEIRIMRLMGATKWYIQWPFIMEGMLYGVVGSVLAFSAVSVALLYAAPTVQQFFGEVNLLPVPLQISGVIAGAGTLSGLILGAVASLLSTRRLFRV